MKYRYNMRIQCFLKGGVDVEDQIDNIILFPKWKKKLEEDSLQALKDKRYKEALEKLDQLIEHHVNNQEILVGKLICLMELGEYVQAQDLAEDLIRVPSDGYFHYMHIYLTILFQTSQYDLLIETVEDALEKSDMPLATREQFQQLYAISQNMRSDMTDKQSKEDYYDLLKAAEDEDHQKQQRLIERLRKTRREPDSLIQALLVKEDVHPVNKTAIFLWLQEQGYSESVEIHKLGKTGTFIPASSLLVDDQVLGQRVRCLIRDVEQNNPSLYQMMADALNRYLYVLHPFAARDEDAPYIAEGIARIADANLNLDISDNEEKLHKYIEEINMCQALYLTMIET